MKLKISLLAMLCLFFKVNAQQFNNQKRLNIGDSVPDLELSNLINSTVPSFNLSIYKDKLLILDFWSTSCGACILSFPKEIELQKKYNGKVDFLLVNTKATKDTKARITTFFKVHHEYQTLTSVMFDTTLNNWFPHHSIPHFVWIKGGTVVAITEDTDVNETNIEKCINGDKLTLSEKTELNYDINKPLFVEDNGGKPESYTHRLILTPYKEGLHGCRIFDYTPDGMITGFRYVMCTRLDLLLAANPEYGQFDQNRIILNVSNPADFSRDSVSLSWRKRNLFIYDEVFPPVTKVEYLTTLRLNIQRMFHLTIDSEYRRVPCLIVKRNVNARNVSPPPNQLNFNKETFERNYPVSSLIDYLNGLSKQPFIDESDFSGTVKMPSDYGDKSVEDIINRLKQEGFTISEETRSIAFVIISDSPNPLSHHPVTH